MYEKEKTEPLIGVHLEVTLIGHNLKETVHQRSPSSLIERETIWKKTP